MEVAPGPLNTPSDHHAVDCTNGIRHGQGSHRCRWWPKTWMVGVPNREVCHRIDGNRPHPKLRMHAFGCVHTLLTRLRCAKSSADCGFVHDGATRPLRPVTLKNAPKAALQAVDTVRCPATMRNSCCTLFPSLLAEQSVATATHAFLLPTMNRCREPKNQLGVWAKHEVMSLRVQKREVFPSCKQCKY